MKRIFAVILAMIIAMACFTGCFMPDVGSGNDSEASECTVGQSVSAGNLEFTFVGVEKYVDNSEWALDSAADGKEYIVFKIKVKNVGEESEHVNMFYEDSYCDDTAIDPVRVLFNYDGETIWGDVAAGRVREGYVAYEAPIGWEKIEFTYEELLGDNKITLVAYAKDVKASSGNKAENESTVGKIENEETEPSNQPLDNECRVGETVKCEGLEFTFLGIEKYVDNSDWALDEPAAGKEFIILKIKVKNVGAEDEHINMFYEDSYCDNTAIDPVSILFNYEGDTIWGDIAAGRVREGYVAYEAPIGWEKIEFIYKFSLSSISDSKVVLVGYNSDVN